MKSLELVENDDSLEKDLEGNELFKRDVKNALCLITPYIPFVGIACGGISIGKHIMKKRSEGTTSQKKNE